MGSRVLAVPQPSGQTGPIEDIGRCKNCAKLFIIAENEELFDNKDHAI